MLSQSSDKYTVSLKRVRTVRPKLASCLYGQSLEVPYLAQPRRIPKASGARARLGGHSIKNGRRRSRATLSTHLVLRKWRGVLILFKSQTHLIRITAFPLLAAKQGPGLLQEERCSVEVVAGSQVEQSTKL